MTVDAHLSVQSEYRKVTTLQLLLIFQLCPYSFLAGTSSSA